ncbi:MAG: hypothetical protein Q8P50_13025 [Bacillota bacterium]|nr:hypothetical protein [Bacillota bacterium]
MLSLEAEMIPIIRPQIVKVLGWHGNYATIEEWPVNNRIVDIAVVLIDTDSVARNQKCHCLTRLTTPKLHVLSLIAHFGTISLQHLCKATFISPDDMHERYLDELVDLGLVQRISRYGYAASEWIELLPRSVAAVEAKLARWQEVLEQAKLNLDFSDLSFAAMPTAAIKEKRGRSSHFEEAGVGVLVVSEQGIELTIQPKPVRQLSPDRTFQRIRVLRSLLLSRQKAKWTVVQGEGNDEQAVRPLANPG